MVELILLGCILGIGCGLIVPLAASLISQYFEGEERAKTLGLKSGLSNVTVIIATLFVGWIAEISWHLSFIVYMMPIIPLCLIPFLTPKFINKNRIVEAPQSPAATSKEAATLKTNTTTIGNSSISFVGKSAIVMLIAIIALYVIVTYGSISLSYYLPFTMQHFHLTSGEVGVATAMFYLAASSAGFSLPFLKRFFGNNTMQAAILMVTIGLYATAMFHWNITYIICTFIVGFGYGIIQPILYDKTTEIAPDKAASTRYFAYLLTGNYVGIAIVPFVVDAMARLFKTSPDLNFSYILNGTVLVILLAVALWKRKSFVFRIK